MENSLSRKIQIRLKWLGLSLLCGILAGTAASIFLISLKWVTEFREQRIWIIGALPLAGLLIGWVYHRYGQEAARGHNLILDEIHNPKNIVPFRMAPLVLGGTLLTHLFGGSAGREGTAVQMGASLSDQLSRFFKVENAERKILLMAGAGAGFGAAIGAPLAGTIFGMEVITAGRVKTIAWLECLVASFTGYYTTLFFNSPHTHYPQIQIPEFDIKTLFWVGLTGLAFGFAARAFIWFTHLIEEWQARLVSVPPVRPFVGGIFIILLFYIEGSYRYSGLGLPVIQDALTSMAHLQEPLLKGFFTALTVGSGFKGGEFIPLVFIGTTLGSALAFIIPVSFQLLGALGFAAVFGGASRTPIACAVMAAEIFGIRILPFALVACFASYYFSGPKGIYKSQGLK